MITTTDQREIDNFTALSDHWWDQQGPMAPLHAFTPIRIDYILRAISRFFPIQTRMLKNTNTALGGLKILDIGCGGGLLAEPMARLGASVTGIDVTDAAIIAAKAHAKTMRVNINYQTSTAEELAASGVIFDVIYASEVIEHVVDRPIFVKAIAQMLAPNGVVIITTINRSLPALIFAKFALEYIVQLVPPGTHDPQKFVKPNELRAEFINAGILLDDMTGFAPRPGGGFRPTGSLAVNYAASGGFH
ncbi:bifunctional 2-polyprenyl-6-hydroxyphenol methylase/3-demethylubiquinol 3-O-methyltransferase UbiG [Candidatus Puniceispirillum sp.]|nr:bifunctional 2-polyprenyl-6-hydroxyphenol methylase/3-demethylubiquinol 3-O-methyltransferase UbiG [Candidatus Puniceispirillum sp.]